MSLQESFMQKGIFNSASNDTDQLHGILHFSHENGIQIELFGQITINGQELKPREIIHGFLAEVKKMSLINPYVSKQTFSMPGFLLSTVSGNFLLVGEHYPSVDRVFFESIRFECSDLNYWLNISGFEKPAYNRDRNELMIKYKLPDNKRYSINKDFDLLIEYDYSGPAEVFVPKESVTIRQLPSIKIAAKNGKAHFKQLLEHYHRFLAFLSIGYNGHPIVSACSFQNNPEQTDNNVPAVKEYDGLLDKSHQNLNNTSEVTDDGLFKKGAVDIKLYYST